MNDYKGIFANDFEDDDFENEFLGSGGTDLKIYRVQVVKRNDTKKIVWAGQVEATSNKNAQEVWRKEYPDVRAKYDHSYALLINRIS